MYLDDIINSTNTEQQSFSIQAALDKLWKALFTVIMKKSQFFKT